MDDKKEKTVISEICNGNSQAFEEVYHQYFTVIFNFVFGFLRSKEDAEEIAQDTLLKIWNYRKKLSKDIPINRLIFKIAKHLVIDKLRKKESQILYIQMQEDFLFQNNPEEEILFKEIEARINNVIDQLPDKRKKIFLMSRYEQLTYKEIAANLNISPKTVEAQIRQALVFIKQAIGETIFIIFIIIFFLFY